MGIGLDYLNLSVRNRLHGRVTRALPTDTDVNEGATRQISIFHLHLKRETLYCTYSVGKVALGSRTVAEFGSLSRW